MITAKTLVAVGEAVMLSPDLATLRKRFPDLMFTECSDDDIPPRFSPALEVDGHNLYLFTGENGHCLALTGDLDHASGIVVAQRHDES